MRGLQDAHRSTTANIRSHSSHQPALLAFAGFVPSGSVWQSFVAPLHTVAKGNIHSNERSGNFLSDLHEQLQVLRNIDHKLAGVLFCS
jgi:hypothetical protein